MAMQQIGIPARTVIERIETLRAASGDAQPARALKGGEPMEERSEGAPTLYADAPASSGSGMGKDRRPKPPAKLGGHQMGPTGKARKDPSPPKRPVLRVLTGGRGMESVYRRKQEFPAPALSRPMLLVIAGGIGAPGDVCKGHHDVSAAS